MVVVVACAWHTEMATALPLGTWVLPAGFWLSTVPGLALLAHAVSNVVLGVRPALAMFACACAAVWPITLGTVAP